MPIDFEIQQGLPCVFTNLPNLTYNMLNAYVGEKGTHIQMHLSIMMAGIFTLSLHQLYQNCQN